MPTLTTKTCPVCGGEIDLFSIDIKGICDRCGFVAFNDTKSCIKWCKYARECVGDKLYGQFMANETAGNEVSCSIESLRLTKGAKNGSENNPN